MPYNFFTGVTGYFFDGQVNIYSYTKLMDYDAFKRKV